MADRYADRYQGTPLHADDEGHGHSPQPQGDSDPLAELARLIGQTDPFAGIAKGRGPSARPVAGEPAVEDAPALPSWMQRVNHRAPVSPPYQPPHEASYEEASYEEAPAEPQAQQYADEFPAAPEFARAGRYAAPEQGGQYDPNLDPSRYDEALYGAPDDAYAPPYGTQDGAGYPADPYGDPRGYDGHGNNQAARPRRGGMAMVAGLVALAFVGTAGAYAYRNLVGGARNGEAPIIKADAGPNKIVPPTQTGDAAGKQIQDRMSPGQGSERIVSREEQPVDVVAPNAPRSGPRIVFPPLTTNPTSATAPATAMPPPRPAATGTVVGDEPHKVRTVAIRPDQPDGIAPAVPPQGRPATAPRAAPSAPTPAPVANAPMSLSPQAAPPTRVATTSPAPAPVSSASGGYLVQIASQRSEADAQASYRALQGKYPSVLGSHTPLIKRADLGDKGVYYRAMVGPFGSPDEASQFCGSLKSAGGQCVVQRN